MTRPPSRSGNCSPHGMQSRRGLDAPGIRQARHVVAVLPGPAAGRQRRRVGPARCRHSTGLRLRAAPGRAAVSPEAACAGLDVFSGDRQRSCGPLGCGGGWGRRGAAPFPARGLTAWKAGTTRPDRGPCRHRSPDRRNSRHATRSVAVIAVPRTGASPKRRSFPFSPGASARRTVDAGGRQARKVVGRRGRDVLGHLVVGEDGVPAELVRTHGAVVVRSGWAGSRRCHRSRPPCRLRQSVTVQPGVPAPVRCTPGRDAVRLRKPARTRRVSFLEAAEPHGTLAHRARR